MLEAKGEVHPGSIWAASAVFDQTIYIYGGEQDPYYYSSTDSTNALSTLSPDGQFQRLAPEAAGGDKILAPRVEHRGFSHNGKVVFLCGVVDQIDESRNEDFIKHDFRRGFYTNDFLQYDPQSNLFTHLLLRGARLTPRSDVAVAALGDRAYIHGGYCNGEYLKDFFSLDMTTLELTQIRDTGLTTGVYDHTLTPASDKHILMVGGWTDKEATKKVMLFDVEKLEWTEEEPLSVIIGSGLKEHRAVKIEMENGAAIVCLGGYSRYPLNSSHMVVFDITYRI